MCVFHWMYCMPSQKTIKAFKDFNLNSMDNRIRIIDLESALDLRIVYAYLKKHGFQAGMSLDEWVDTSNSGKRREMLIRILSDGKVDHEKMWREVYLSRVSRNTRRLLRLSLYSIILISVLFATMKFIGFSRLDRIYAVGESVIVPFSNGKSETFSFGDNHGLLNLGADSTGMLLVQSPSFIPWLLGDSGVAKVAPLDFFVSADSMRMYLDLYSEAAGNGWMKDWTPSVRRRVFNAIHGYFKSPSEKISIVASPTSPIKDYPLPLLLHNDALDKKVYLFATLRGIGKNANLRMTFKGDSSMIEPLLLPKAVILTGTTYWKKPSSAVAPIIEFVNGNVRYELAKPDEEYAVSARIP
jgi:hypothetical protein